MEMDKDIVIPLTFCVVALIGLIYAGYCRWYKGKTLSDNTFTVLLSLFAGMGMILMTTTGIWVDYTNRWAVAIILAGVGGVIVWITKVVCLWASRGRQG